MMDRWDDNGLQFARLIVKLEQADAFTPEVMEFLTLDMDLEESEIYELVSRAQTEWEKRKTFF